MNHPTWKEDVGPNYRLDAFFPNLNTVQNTPLLVERHLPNTILSRGMVSTRLTPRRTFYTQGSSTPKGDHQYQAREPLMRGAMRQLQARPFP
jgi:hypothetical protein